MKGAIIGLRAFGKALNVKGLNDSVETLAKKTESVLKRWKASREAAEALQRDNLQLRDKVSHLTEELDLLKSENKVLKMAAAVKGNEETVTETKRRISQMVREIDRCIAKLNDES